MNTMQNNNVNIQLNTEANVNLIHEEKPTENNEKEELEQIELKTYGNPNIQGKSEAVNHANLNEKHQINTQASIAVKTPDDANKNALVNVENKETLPGEQKEGEKGQAEEEKSVNFFKLMYTFLTSGEICLVILATCLSICTGATWPAFMIIFGEVVNEMSLGTRKLPNFNSTLNDTLNPAQADLAKTAFVNSINLTCSYFVYLGIGFMVISAVNLIIWSNTGKILGRRIRNIYFQSIMRQEQNWFDQYKNKFEFTTKVETQTKTIESGLGSKVGNLLNGISMFIGKTSFLNFSLPLLIIYLNLENEFSNVCYFSSFNTCSSTMDEGNNS